MFKRPIAKLTVLDPKTMAAGTSYDAGQPFTTAPVAFQYKTKTLVALETKDGAVNLVADGRFEW